MKKVFIATGYNSFTNKNIVKAFKTEQETSAFLEGLTDPRIQVLSYRSTLELVNALLGV